jgi:ferric iron reductase protein FhuF
MTRKLHHAMRDYPIFLSSDEDPIILSYYKDKEIISSRNYRGGIISFFGLDLNIFYSKECSGYIVESDNVFSEEEIISLLDKIYKRLLSCDPKLCGEIFFEELETTIENLVYNFSSNDRKPIFFIKEKFYAIGSLDSLTKESINILKNTDTILAIQLDEKMKLTNKIVTFNLSEVVNFYYTFLD